MSNLQRAENYRQINHRSGDPPIIDVPHCTDGSMIPAFTADQCYTLTHYVDASLKVPTNLRIVMIAESHVQPGIAVTMPMDRVAALAFADCVRKAALELPGPKHDPVPENE